MNKLTIPAGLSLLVICLAVLTVGCEQEETPAVLNTRETTTVWVTIDPIQCLSNPWEQDWLASHDNDYDAYPRDEESRLEIFSDFELPYYFLGRRCIIRPTGNLA